MGQMEGKVAVVSGWESPLRAALAQRLRDEGALVSLVEPGATGVASIGRTAGKIDALVNVLKGQREIAPFAEGEAASLETMLGQVGDFAAGMRAAWPYLLKGNDARVVNVCAPQGSTTYYGFAETVAADCALQGLTRAVGAEWARHNVLVNCLVPGLVDLPELADFQKEHPTLFSNRLGNTALQRLGDASRDVGGALMLLLSDEGCYMVGHPVYADGGQHLSTAVYDPVGLAALAER